MAKTIIVTGASSGIGAATAKKFLNEGWNVAMLARRLEKLDEISSKYENAVSIVCDVTKEDAVQKSFSKVVEHFGEINVLFNNAGIFPPGSRFDEVSLEAWQSSVDVNLTGMFLCAREAFRHMAASGGRIINNGSISAATPRPNSAAYTATKHAITGLTKSIALDGRDLNICCGQIDIGNAKTELVENLIKHADGPMDTMDPKDAANAVLHMASLPLSTNVLSMTIMANKMPFVGRG
ncbi:SDR family oxidoreductase [Amylibacter sp. SFDW26]|uniref:SDR family oxidoreductase n=1 Tax=Amylibacter sp. SFDW26 TaxID=2652722 RepID=UPI00126193CF|nr:SDR family oxidoreductase [Amylibacter sp. SFDW26]KAB7615274.1 SDR family oxidoreductase [Amylibacter sp. SFDW26]